MMHHSQSCELHLNHELRAGQHQGVVCAAALSRSRSLQCQPQHLPRIDAAIGHAAQCNRPQDALRMGKLHRVWQFGYHQMSTL